MGRGSLEYGRFRSERVQLDTRTSDPANPEEVEAWLRVDQADLANDKLAEFRFYNGSVRRVDVLATGSTDAEVEEVLRVQTPNGVGVIPTMPRADAPHPEWSLRHDGATLGLGMPSAIPDSGVSRYELEQDVTDSWGGNDGTDNTSAGYTTDSAVGSYAKSFDGADDYVELPLFPDGFFEDDFSISHWVKINSSHDSKVFHPRAQSDVSTETRTGPEVAMSYYDPSSSERITASVSTGTWYHVVGVFDYSDGEMRLYVDGSMEVSGGLANPYATSDTNAFGVRTDNNSLWFDGDLDDPRIYDKALTGSEVSNLYNSGSI